MAQVTAGCDTTYFSRNCPQLVTSISAAQAAAFGSAPDAAAPRTRREYWRARRCAAAPRAAALGGCIAVVDGIVDLDEIKRVALHEAEHLLVLLHTRCGDADVADLARLLPLLKLWHQLIDAVEVVNLQQIHHAAS